MLTRVTASIACWLAVISVATAQPPASGQESATKSKTIASKLTSELAAKVKERDAFATHAKNLQKEGKLLEAIEIVKHILGMEREIFGAQHAEIAGSLDWIADMQDAIEDFSSAEKSRQEVLELLTKLYGAEYWQATDARLALTHTRLLARLNPPDRKELNQLTSVAQQMVEFHSAGNLSEAIKSAEEWLQTVRRILGEEHSEYATGLNNLAFLYNSKGDDTRAEPLYRLALEINKKVRGESHPAYATALNNLALLYRSKGNFAQAEPLIRQAVEIRKKVLGESHPDYATALNNLALLYHSKGDYARAEPLYHQALEIRSKVLGESHPSYAESLNNLAGLYDSMADYARAEPLYRQALEVRKKVHGETHPDYARTLRNLAGLYKSKGDWVRAEAIFLQALQINKKVPGESHPDYTASLNNLAELYRSKTDYARAEPLYVQALQINKRVLGESHPDYAVSLNNLAVLYGSKGDYARAEPLCRQALEITKKALGDDHHSYATSLNNLADLYCSMGDYARAEPLFQQALEIRSKVLGKSHPSYAESLNNLAVLYGSKGDYARAEPFYRQALDIKKKVLSENHPDYAFGLHNLAYVYIEMQDFARAEQLSKQAQLILKKAYGEEHALYVGLMNNLADLSSVAGDHLNSSARLRNSATSYEAVRLRVSSQGLERAAFGANKSPYQRLAAAEANQGDWVEAWRALEFDLGRGLLDEATRRAGLQLTAEEETKHVELTTAIENIQPRILKLIFQKEQNDDVQAELDDLLQQRSTAEARTAQLAAAINQRQIADLKELQSALPANGAFVTWVDVSNKHFKMQEHWGCIIRVDRIPGWVRLPGTGPDKSWTDDDTSLTLRFRQILSQSAAPEKVESLARQVASQRIEPLLPHLEGIDRLFVAGVNAMGGVPVDVLTDRFTISYIPSGTQLARLRRKERSSTGQTTLLALGDPEFNRPAEESSEPASTRLPPSGLLINQIVPKGNADRARLETGDVLLTYAGTELTSVQQLGELVTAHTRDESVIVTVWRQSQDQPVERKLQPGKLSVVLARDPAPVALANRRESDLLLASVTRGKTWDELPGTRIEIARIGNSFGNDQATLLADSNASEQRLAALRDSGELAQFQYVHLATHGHVDEASAFESAMILAQDHLSTVDDVTAGAEFIDGRLTANEILDKWKLNAELVTLSSCESGLGRKGGGEGFLGFAQALLLAGSRSVCLSLWEVDDTATALLMDRFYQNLLGKRDGLTSPLTKAEALAEAKRWLRTLTASQAAELAASLSHGVARGAGRKTTVVNLPPPTSSASHPYDHPYYWAAFVLIGAAD